MMKGRLDLENFSGQTAEAVRQDFFATLFLCNVESVVTQSSGQALREQSAGDKHPKQVNRAVAYHALKDQLLDLLYSELPVEQVVEKLQRMFLGAAVAVRPERKPPRPKLSLYRSYHFQRRVKKNVFLTKIAPFNCRLGGGGGGGFSPIPFSCREGRAHRRTTRLPP